MTSSQSDPTASALSISIVRGDPTPAEVAAVTAVVSAALEEIADDNARQSSVGVSAWQRSQRTVRSPLHPGHGAWRSFSG
ncbi:hypothetical protein BH11ACT2_BH11ACT2_08560 [soil metagenome]